MGQPRHEEGCMHFLDRQMQRSSKLSAMRYYSRHAIPLRMQQLGYHAWKIKDLAYNALQEL